MYTHGLASAPPTVPMAIEQQYDALSGLLEDYGSSGSPCARQGGSCGDRDTQICSTGWRTGLCPGPANIVCCFGDVSAKQPAPGRPGTGYEEPPPGVTTAGFPWWVVLLVIGGVWYGTKN